MRMRLMYMCVRACVLACMNACVCMCVSAYVRLCVCLCVHVRACVCARARVGTHYTIICGSCHKYHFCRDKSYVFVVTKYFCCDKYLPRRTRVCRDKHTFVATKDVFCRDEYVFVATKVSLSRQNLIVVSRGT